MFRKLFLLCLMLLALCLTPAFAEAAVAASPVSVLPALPESPVWYGAGSGAAPDVRSTDDDGNVLLTYHGVSARDYADYSRKLGEAGFTLTTHLYNDSSMLASLTDGETPLRVQYDTVMCELTVTLPELSFLRGWAVPAEAAAFWGCWALDWYWEDEEFSQEEEYAPRLFLSEEACYSYDENYAVSFDGRLLTLISDRYGYEYVLFFDASGMLQMYVPGEPASANLKPIIDPFWLLGTWEVVEAVQNGKAVDLEGTQLLRCTPEGVYDLVGEEVYSDPYPWVNARGSNAAVDAGGIRFYLTWTEEDQLTMTASAGENTVWIKMELRVDISELLGAWRVTAFMADGVEVPADPENDQVLLIAEDGIVMYDNGEPQDRLIWVVLGTWPGNVTMQSLYFPDGSTEVGATYHFTLGEDGRLYCQLEDERVVLTLDPAFSPPVQSGT